MKVTLASFGRFQTGTSVQAPLYYPLANLDGCLDSFRPDGVETHGAELEMKGFVMVEAGGCTYETKARNIEKTGA